MVATQITLSAILQGYIHHMPLPTPVLIVEDNDACARRFQGLVVGCGVEPRDVDTAGNLSGARDRLRSKSYGLALVDMYLPDGMGSTLIRDMALLQPALQAVVASAFGTDDLVLDAIRAGAVGYLMKDADDDEIAWSLSCVGRGGAAINPGIARRLLAMAAELPPPRTPEPALPPTDVPSIELSPREHEVLQLIAEGCTNKEVANRLALSVHTIDFYAKRLYGKLSARSRTQAVGLARAGGLLD